ncbi:energy transducer TonB [uncultured Sphingomonas sp.]|uniref:energy transducer TonB n=1 Tax=uncultured Sphingomonas sp. TaxID=158754 RepID=UPI0035CC1ED9
MDWTISMMAALAAQAVTPDALPPAGKWIVQYGEGDCTVSRSFGPTAAPVTFAFQPSPTGSLGEVLLMMPASVRKGVQRGEGAVVLRPSGARFEARFAVGPLSDGRRGGRFATGQEFWDALPTATSLSMELGGEPPFAIALGAMDKPLAAAKICSDKLLRSWGAEPGAVARFRDGTSPAQYFTYYAYPEAAIRAREQGRTVALVTVDRTGKPSTCRTVRSAGSATLDKTTCMILMNSARFEPASATEAERRFAVLPVRWALP